MKTLLIPLFALIAVVPLAGQEVMENADMADGTTHWHGNCRVAGADSSTDFITNKGGLPKGIVVNLRSSSWTKITQEMHDFKGAPGRGMVLTIEYQVSPDFKLSTIPTDYENVGPALEFGGANLPGVPGRLLAFVDMPPNSRSSMTSSGGVNLVTIYSDYVSSAGFAPKTDASTQTFTAPMHPHPATHDDNPVFCLAFPPGHGSVTITKISLMPGGAPGMAP